MVGASKLTMGQKCNREVFPVHISSILHGTLVDASSLYRVQQDATLYRLVLYAITRTGDVFRFQQQNTRNFHCQGFLLFSNMKKKVIMSPTLPWAFKDQFSWHKYRALRVVDRRIGQSGLPLNPRGSKSTAWFFFSMFSDYAITSELFWYCSAGAIVEQFHIQSPSCLNPSQA